MGCAKHPHRHIAGRGTYTVQLHNYNNGAADHQKRIHARSEIPSIGSLIA